MSVKPSFGRRTAGGQLTSVAVADVALKIPCYTVAVPSVRLSVPRRRRRQSRFSILLLRRRGRGHRSQPMVSRVSTMSLGIINADFSLLPSSLFYWDSYNGQIAFNQVHICTNLNFCSFCSIVRYIIPNSLRTFSLPGF